MRQKDFPRNDNNVEKGLNKGKNGASLEGEYEIKRGGGGGTKKKIDQSRSPIHHGIIFNEAKF